MLDHLIVLSGSDMQTGVLRVIPGEEPAGLAGSL